MKNKTNRRLEGMIARSRRVYRVPADERPLDLPLGFVRRVLDRGSERPPAALLLWQRASFLGAAAAAVIALGVLIIQPSAGLESLDDDPWLDMAESSESQIDPARRS